MLNKLKSSAKYRGKLSQTRISGRIIFYRELKRLVALETQVKNTLAPNGIFVASGPFDKWEATNRQTIYKMFSPLNTKLAVVS